ncbi:MAG: hypothetical protein ACI90V_006040 [Bacillariaceae sp.]
MNDRAFIAEQYFKDDDNNEVDVNKEDKGDLKFEFVKVKCQILGILRLNNREVVFT